MDKGTRIGWRSSLMAPVCFVIRRRIKGEGVKEKEAEREKEDRCPERQHGPGATGRTKRIWKEEIRAQLRANCRGYLLKKAKPQSYDPN